MSKQKIVFMKQNWIGPAILATAIIMGTLLSVVTSSLRWLVLSGPLLLAVATFGVGVLYNRFYQPSRGRLWTSLIIGVTIITASAIVAQNDPDYVAQMLPIIGAGTVVVLMNFPRKSCDEGNKARVNNV